MKLPVNPEVVKVYVKFYSLLKKVKEEARKILDKIKAEAYEYVQNSKAFTQLPLLKSWLLSSLKPLESWRQNEARVWTWQGGTTFTPGGLSDVRSSLSSMVRYRNPPLYTPFGTPVIYGSVRVTPNSGPQGANAAWIR